MEDTLAIISLVTFILFCTLASETLIRYGIVSAAIGRKLLHITAITCCAFAPLIIINHTLLVAVVSAFTCILFFAVRKKLFHLDKVHSNSWGIFFFAISFLTLIILCHPHGNYLIFYPMLIMAWSDSAAGLAGMKFSKNYFQPINEKKSWIGCITFFITTCLILLIPTLLDASIIPVIPIFDNVYLLLSSIVLIGLVLSLSEALSARGSDNLSVPLVAAILMHILFENKTSTPQHQYWLALLLATSFALVAYRFKMLSLSGALTAFILAFFVFGIGALQWTVPILFFFLSGSLASKLNRKSGLSSDSKSKKPRDYIQVLCNGGIGLLCLWCYGITANYLWYMLYLVSIAVSTSDTLSSEIGIYLRGKAFSILNFKKMSAGVSGAVSISGTLAGIAGAMCIALIGVIFLNSNQINLFFLITAFGFAGSVVDSVLGAWLQAKYIHTDTLSDVPLTANEKLFSGLKWMTNDMVNLLSNLIVSLIALFILSTIAIFN